MDADRSYLRRSATESDLPWRPPVALRHITDGTSCFSESRPPVRTRNKPSSRSFHLHYAALPKTHACSDAEIFPEAFRKRRWRFQPFCRSSYSLVRLLGFACPCSSGGDADTKHTLLLFLLGAFCSKNSFWPGSYLESMAEREGFEPSIEFPLYTLSKRAPSTTRPSLRGLRMNVGKIARELQSNMRGHSNRVTLGAREQLFGALQSAGFGVLASIRYNSRQRRAGRHIVSLGMPLIAKFIRCKIHLPAVDVHFSFAEMLWFHACTADFAAPFSTGAPTRLPHSVQEPS